MRIALEFDGVVIDLSGVRSTLAERLFNKKIHPAFFKDEFVVGSGLLTVEQLSEIDSIAFNKDIIASVKPVANAVEQIGLLSGQGHKVIAFVADESQVEGAAIWARANSLAIETVPYDSEANNARVVVSTHLEFLHDLESSVRSLFFFSDEKAYINTGYSIWRVSSWPELYRHLSKMKERNF